MADSIFFNLILQYVSIWVSPEPKFSVKSSELLHHSSNTQHMKIISSLIRHLAESWKLCDECPAISCATSMKLRLRNLWNTSVGVTVNCLPQVSFVACRRTPAAYTRHDELFLEKIWVNNWTCTWVNGGRSRDSGDKNIVEVDYFSSCPAEPKQHVTSSRDFRIISCSNALCRRWRQMPDNRDQRIVFVAKQWGPRERGRSGSRSLMGSFVISTCIKLRLYNYI